MKKAIVTGANGFVGSYLTDELNKRGYEIWAVVKDKNENISSIKKYSPNIIYCELSDILSLTEVIPKDEYDCFYHLAWAGSSGEARKNYQLQLDNAKGCANAAQAAANLNCKRFVGAGSVTELMYGNYLQKDGSTPEMSACYAVGKMSAEYMSKCVCIENKIDFLWGYISNLYGVGDFSDNIINFLIKSYLNGIVPELTDGFQMADFIYVSDVAEALVAIGEKGKTNSSYYIGYGEPRPFREFVLKIKNIVEPKLESGLGRRSFNGNDINFDTADINKLKQDTGFMPKISFNNGIHKVIKWINE